MMVDARGFLLFVADIFDVPSEMLSLGTTYGSIPEWDSVMQLRLVLEIGDAYGVEIPVDEIAEMRSLRQFYDYVCRSGVGA